MLFLVVRCSSRLDLSSSAVECYTRDNVSSEVCRMLFNGIFVSTVSSLYGIKSLLRLQIIRIFTFSSYHFRSQRESMSLHPFQHRMRNKTQNSEFHVAYCILYNCLFERGLPDFPQNVSVPLCDPCIELKEVSFLCVSVTHLRCSGNWSACIVSSNYCSDSHRLSVEHDSKQ